MPHSAVQANACRGSAALTCLKVLCESAVLFLADFPEIPPPDCSHEILGGGGISKDLVEKKYSAVESRMTPPQHGTVDVVNQQWVTILTGHRMMAARDVIA
jgi:hypothetical protein